MIAAWIRMAVMETETGDQCVIYFDIKLKGFGDGLNGVRVKKRDKSRLSLNSCLSNCGYNTVNYWDKKPQRSREKEQWKEKMNNSTLNVLSFGLLYGHLCKDEKEAVAVKGLGLLKRGFRAGRRKHWKGKIQENEVSQRGDCFRRGNVIKNVTDIEWIRTTLIFRALATPVEIYYYFGD